MGYDYYSSPAVVEDGSSADAPDPWGSDYRQNTRPGHRLPHAWLHHDGRRLSTHDLLRPGTFLLLTGADDGDWSRVADVIAERFDVAIDCVRIDEDTWQGLRGHDDAGALLVRPDGHIAFRAPSAVAHHEQAIAAAIGTALSARVPDPA